MADSLRELLRTAARLHVYVRFEPDGGLTLALHSSASAMRSRSPSSQIAPFARCLTNDRDAAVRLAAQ